MACLAYYFLAAYLNRQYQTLFQCAVRKLVILIFGVLSTFSPPLPGRLAAFFADSPPPALTVALELRSEALAQVLGTYGGSGIFFFVLKTRGGAAKILRWQSSANFDALEL